MAISRMIANITQYISEAVMRIFAPSDDAYPVIGVQPFTGDPYRKGTADIW
ncbi:MAG: nicotinate phosphoribosyltransferase [Aulosira sp. DedQUE10]|nr:nicotinate phosphoribosyltransferase [Aulosira sp. DedQUE10]